MPMVISYENLSVTLAYLLGLGQWDRIRMKSSPHFEMPKMSSISLLTQDHKPIDLNNHMHKPESLNAKLNTIDMLNTESTFCLYSAS